MLKKIAIILSWVIIISAIVGSLYSFTYKNFSNSCKKINISIINNENFFVNKEDILKIVNKLEDSVVGTPIYKINTDLIEENIEKHPSIENSEVYKSINNELFIEITQREPILRVFYKNGNSFYIDKNGEQMPLSENYSSRVIIANGNIDETMLFARRKYKIGTEAIIDSLTLYDKLLELSTYINNNPFWKAQIMQIYVTKNYEFELVPRVGNHIILFGDEKNIDKKFNKLMIFYREGLKKIGWNNYKTVNLKYSKQVVCTQN